MQMNMIEAEKDMDLSPGYFTQSEGLLNFSMSLPLSVKCG